MRFVALLGALLLAIKANAEQPDSTVFELGIGVGHSVMPEYVGSKESKSYNVPFPYIYYRRDDVKINRDSIQGLELFDGRVRFGLDYGINLPLKSKNNQARLGMDDLNPVLMTGPKAVLCVAANCKKDFPLRMYLSVMKPFVMDSAHFNDLDWVSRIGIKYDETILQNREHGKLSFSTTARMQFQGSHYSDYYYGIGVEDVTSERTLYKSASGYAGYQLSAGLTWRKDNWWAGAFAQYIDINHAQVADSPLVTDADNYRVGFAFAWVFKQ